MTWQEMDACFACAARNVTVDVYRRYIAWRLTVCDSRFMSPQYAVNRYEWAMSDPDWAEALMLARLGGRW